MSAMQDMTKGGAAGHLLRYAVPLMLGNWFQLAYNAVDSSLRGGSSARMPWRPRALRAR